MSSSVRERLSRVVPVMPRTRETAVIARQQQPDSKGFVSDRPAQASRFRLIKRFGFAHGAHGSPSRVVPVMPGPFVRSVTKVRSA